MLLINININILPDILNIVTVLTFGMQHRGNDGFTTGEAFWMTICSTIVSTITNMTLIWDFVKTPNFAKAGKWVLALYIQVVCLASRRQRNHTQATLSRHHYYDLLDIYRTRSVDQFSHDEPHLHQRPIFHHRHYTYHRLWRHRADNTRSALRGLFLRCIWHHHP